MKEKQKTSCERLFADLENARAINEENLRIILSDNRDTAFGREHGFSGISSPEEYAEKIALSDYSLYEGRITKPGEFTAYPFEDFLATSGSTGVQKIFPLTKEALGRYSSYVHDLPYYLTDTAGPAIHTSVFRSAQNGLNILSAAYFRWLCRSGEADFSRFVGGSELLFSDEAYDVPYLKTRLMFSCPELEAIQSIYIYDVAMLFAWMEENWRGVISDMRSGTVSANLGESVKKALLALTPPEAVIDRIERGLSEGFDTPVLPRLWKNIRFVCGVGGKMYSASEQQLCRYIGNVPVYQFSYALSECIIAPAIEMTNAHYVLLPRSAYYEFLTKEGEEPIPFGDIRIGEEYELVITTFSGLYRYRTGDLIKIIRFEKEAPVIELVGKRKLLLDVAGEKTDAPTAEAAVRGLGETFGFTFADFGIGVNYDRTPNGYRVFIEKDGDDGGADPVVPGSAECFDEQMKKLSPDYEDLRSLGLLGLPEVYFVRRGEIAESLRAMGILSHSKPQVFFKPFRTDFLMERIRNR